MSSTPLSRRRFIYSSAALAAAAALPAFGQRTRKVPANEKLNIAIIGAGGRGAENLKGVSTENIVALCDVDMERAADAFKQYPAAAQYTDWRRLLDREKNIDAVVISTPDHTHATIAAAALRAGKHVYCEKPLTRTIYEARTLQNLASKGRLVTQMGQQGHATEGTRRLVETLRSGALGDVTEVHVWTDRPAGWWPQGVTRPRQRPRIPQTLDWDLWLGPAPLRPYNPIYVPFKWRGFYEYGTGAIGDMGVHNFDAAYWGLELGEPIIAEVKESSEGTEDSPPLWSITELTFPKSGTKPPIKVTFYDGKKLPPTDLFQGETPTDNGALIIGKNGTIYQRTWHGGMGESDMFKFIGGDAPAEAQPTSKTQLPRSEAGHHQEWILACKGQGKAMSDFNYASRLTESLLVGQLAIRTGKRIEWNAAKMRATNAPEADIFINPPYRKGWTL